MNSLKNPNSVEFRFNNNDIEFSTITIELYAQKVLALLGQNGSYEVLSRIGTNQGSVEKFLEDLSKKDTVSFDYFVIGEVIQFLCNNPGVETVLHINISPYTISSSDFMESLFGLFRGFSFEDYQKIKFEILENGYFSPDEMVRANKNIHSLSEKGIETGIDDYPNQNNNHELLGHIKGITFVKLDKGAIIDYIEGRIDKQGLLNRIEELLTQIDNSTNEKPHIVLEGVENKEVFEMILEKFGERIRFYQGYYFHFPSSIHNLAREK